MPDYSNNFYVKRAREYCSSPKGIASIDALAKKAKELSDLLEQSMIVSPELWHSQITI